MAWVELEKGSDWGCEYYALKGKVLDPKYGTASVRNGIDLSNLEKIHVKFKDGHEEEVRVVTKKSPYHIRDHGCSDIIHNTSYGFEVNIHGHTLWLDFVEVMVLLEDLRAL